MTEEQRPAAGTELPGGAPARPRARAGRYRFVIGFALVLSAMAILVARGAKNSMVYYITVSELLAKDRDADLKGLRVAGTVLPGSVEKQDFSLRFQLTDGTQAVPVNYRGIVPDTFAERAEAVVEGHFTTEGTFEANFLMAKCPSKYEMSPDKEKPAGHPMHEGQAAPDAGGI